MHTACCGKEADPGLRQAELGMVSRNEDIAHKCDLKTATHGEAVDCADDRFIAFKIAGSTAEAARVLDGHSSGIRSMFRLVFKIVTGRESPLACTGHNSDPNLGIIFKIRPYLVKLITHRGADGVHYLGPVDRNIGDPALFLIENVFIRQNVTSLLKFST